MDIRDWIDRRGGIVHRSDILEAGVSARALRGLLAAGLVRRVRRYWVATRHAPADLVAAAERTARVACVSVARRRGWWIPPDVDESLHLAVRAHASVPDDRGVAITVHWSIPLGAASARRLVEPVEDALQHIADCLTFEQAVVLWESAVKTERIAPEALRRIRWRTPAARRVAAALTGQMDSGLETIFAQRLASWALPLRFQVEIAGHPVDALIADRLVVQIDGFAFHSSSADRTRDLAHDRELIARGYTVLRFSYAEIIYHWERVEHAIARAVAQGLHLAA